MSQLPAGPVYDRDREHLKLLSIGYYIMSGFDALGVCFISAYTVFAVVFGVAAAAMPRTAPKPGQPPPPPPEVITAFAGFFVMILLVVLAMSVAFLLARIYAGICLSKRKHHTFIVVVAALSCLNMPFGTLLGVFTFIVLFRPSVKALFDGPPAVPPLPPTPPTVPGP